MTGSILRGEENNKYVYYLQVAADGYSRIYRIYRSRNHSKHIKRDGFKTRVYFNEHLLPQVTSIPMKQSTDDDGCECWDMVYEYRQMSGGADKP